MNWPAIRQAAWAVVAFAAQVLLVIAKASLTVSMALIFGGLKGATRINTNPQKR